METKFVADRGEGEGSDESVVDNKSGRVQWSVALGLSSLTFFGGRWSRAEICSGEER